MGVCSMVVYYMPLAKPVCCAAAVGAMATAGISWDRAAGPRRPGANLAAQHPADRAAYSAAKACFVQGILVAAQRLSIAG